MSKKSHYLYGYHSVKALLTMPAAVNCLWLQSGLKDTRLQELAALAQKNQIVVNYIGKSDLEKRLGKVKGHQGIVAECDRIPQYSESDIDNLFNGFAEPYLLLVLDGVQDPQNLGAILRTADAMGVQAVMAPSDRAVGLTPTVVKVAAGAAFTIPFIQVGNLSRALKQLQNKGIWMVGADAEAELLLPSVDLSGNIALVLGGEGKGLRRLTKEHCDYLARIPMQGTVASLNVSVATAMFLYEAKRQR